MDTKILHAALFTPTTQGWGLPLLLWGAPGIAKTAIIRALGRRYGWHVEVLSPGERGEGAFGVVPVPVTHDGKTLLSYPAPEWTDALRDGKGAEAGLVLVDEVTSAPPAIHPALLGIVLDKRVGGKQLGGRVRVMGAANPPEQAAAGWDLPAPNANRFGHHSWHLDAEDWTAWLTGGMADPEPIDPVKEEARVEMAWPEAFALASGTVAAFIRRRPELLHKMPKSGDPAAGRAWPSPRSWEAATRALASSRIHDLSETDTDTLMGAFIGDAAVGEFRAWSADLDLPEPAALLDGKIKWAHDPKRLDRTDAVLAACAALVTPQRAAARDVRADALWKILGQVMGDAKDLVVPAAQALVQNKLQHEPNKPTTNRPEARNVLAALKNVVTP